MSTNLYWRPEYNAGKSVGDDGFKFAMREIYGTRVNTVLREEDLGILTGLGAAGYRKPAKALMDAIKKHDHVRLYEE